jgi:predicted AlkP superfamily pyrophosphatase or phosphodiesterase
MILAEVQQDIERRISGDRVHPDYAAYCLAQLPAAVLTLWGLRPPGPPLAAILQRAAAHCRAPCKVVLLLVDGFGWRQWLRYAEQYAGFARLSARGLVAPITTVFPSTTAAALTSVHTGLTPQQHGIPEWWVYLEELDSIVATLPFTRLGAKGRDRLLDEGVKPAILYDGPTLYQALARAGVPSFTFIRDVYARSAYSGVVHKGSQTIPFINASDLLVNVRRKLLEVSGPAYFYVYWDAVDAISHHYGPHTEHYHAELAGFSYLLQRELIDKVDARVAEEALLIVTADHGHLNVVPKAALYLQRYPTLVRSLQRSPAGKPILPWGSPRDLFLRVQAERLPAIVAWLRRRLGDLATVMTIDEAVQQGLFGLGKPHRRFRQRVGNLLILPQRDHLIWYEHLKGKKFDFLGMHGGLTVDEMLIPLAVAPLASLR